MALKHPVAVYTASSNLEAHVIVEMLREADIEAAAVEDESRAAAWMFGNLPGIHKPQVWVEQTDVERVRPLLDEFERRQSADGNAAVEGAPIHVVCEECRKTTTFDASRRGHVDECLHCGAFVDVGEAEADAWDVGSPSEDG
jgi:hypothetical protein